MVLGFIIRCGIVGGAIYYSQQLGVWGSCEETEELYNKMKENLGPHIKELVSKIPFEVPSTPESGEYRYLAKHYYNKGVKETFSFIEMLPCYTSQLLDRARDEFQKLSQTKENTKSK